MDRPTAGNVLDRSELLTQRFPEGAGDSRLQILVEDANVWVEQLTKRVPLETKVPDALARVALQAVTMKTEEFAESRRRQIASAAATGSRIKSFTAGSYSETRADPGFEWKAGLLSANSALQEALWMLLSEEDREEIRALATGQPVPESAVQSFDWNRDRQLGPPRSY